MRGALQRPHHRPGGERGHDVLLLAGFFAELNRARQGRAELRLVLERMREIVALVAAGVDSALPPAHDAAVPASPATAR